MPDLVYVDLEELTKAQLRAQVALRHQYVELEKDDDDA